MMNHHLPAMNHGQPPIPQQRRQHEMPYVTGPPNLRSPPAYMGYPNGHMGHPMYPPQPHHYQQQWYPSPYQPGPPHQRYGHPQQQPQPPMPQQPYAPFVVSSYPSAQPSPAIAPSMIPPSMPPSSQPAPVTPLQPPYSPASPIHAQSIPPHYVASAYGQGQYIPAPPMEPTTPQIETPQIEAPQPVPETVKPFVGNRQPFYPELPWASHAVDEFPQRSTRRKRRARALSMAPATVQLPAKPSQTNEAEDSIEESSDNVCDTPNSEETQTTVSEVAQESEASVPAPEPSSPMTSQAPSETPDSTQPTTPASTIGPQSASETSRPTPTQTQNRPPRPVIPVVPIVPAQKRQPPAATENTPPKAAAQPSVIPSSTETTPEAVVEKAEESKSPPAPAAPRLWADLVRNKQTAAAAAAGTPGPVNGFKGPKPESLGDVLETMGTDAPQFGDKISFLEPRGLVNTGNMCYMNSVLQVLVFCLPFYEFLDRIGRRAAHRFQSDSPLIEAMIMFLREFRVIDAADSADQLRLRLKQTELEQYGEQFTPEYVYSAIRQLPRFRDMRRGHQQDAQEFLGFLLEELHEECVRSTKTRTSSSGSLQSVSAETAAAISAAEGAGDNGWLEVGHKQKSAVTRQSGVSMESPVTRIFGGKIRSEFRVPGNKTSVTLEPYQPLQLDIGAPEINNIIDALKGLTKPESIQGDFNSSRGANVNATKQVFLETLPPVLILHLKRFQYDSTGGTQKIWKKIGYPLDLEIPREAFPPQRRSVLATQPGGLPKYKLVGVIYHHGKNASGGHYTVDVRRQDGKEWIRLDDTVIRRVRSEEVASAGSEEDPKVLAAALERHKHQKNNGTSTSSNMFEQIDNTDTESDKGWSQVNGAAGGHGSKKSVSLQAQAATNGVSTPTNAASSGGRTPVPKYSVKDNKVAYLLFYQRV